MIARSHDKEFPYPVRTHTVIHWDHMVYAFGSCGMSAGNGGNQGGDQGDHSYWVSYGSSYWDEPLGPFGNDFISSERIIVYNSIIAKQGISEDEMPCLHKSFRKCYNE